MFNRVCVAGTFDGLHKGHEAMLMAAFEAGTHVVIAITSDVFVRTYKVREVAGYAKRLDALVVWLKTRNLIDRSEIISIDDAVGPAATADIDALIVTSQNKHVGEQINALRTKRHIASVVLIDVPLISAQDHQVISSTRIRRGEIDRAGRLTMPDNMRDELSKPLGVVLRNDAMIARSIMMHKDDVIMSVGDMTTKTLVDAGITPRLSIVDNKVNRKRFTGLDAWLAKRVKFREKYVSGPGFISAEVVKKIRNWANQPDTQLVLVIDGEEDLLALPVLATSPIGSVLYYGQPKASSWACGPIVEGIVEVVVNAQNKELANTLLAKFIV